MATKFIDLTRVPVVREGFYATNNQFQKSGPKGFIEVKILPNDKLYVRVDLPGVQDDAVRTRVDAVRQKVVFFSGEACKELGDEVREYSGTAGLGCDCCEITNVDANMKDGVLRMILTRVKVKDHDKKCTLTVPTDLTGKSGLCVEDHPFVVEGRKGAFFGRPTKDKKGLIFTVDVPGANTGDVEVLANKTEVLFTAKTKKVFEHDEGGRVYKGSFEYGRVGSTDDTSSVPSLLNGTIQVFVQFGLLLVIITPPAETTN